MAEEIDPNEMVPVPIREFLSAKTVKVNIYIRLSDAKFVQVFKAGEALELERLKTYKTKSIEVLYVRKENYGAYVSQHIQVAGMFLNRGDIEASKKSAVVGRMASAVLKELEGMGFSHETFERARAVTAQTIVLVEGKVELTDLFESLLECSDQVGAHSMAVSAVSVMIAHGLGWQKHENIEKAALAGLLHDIGKKELPPELLSKPRAQMNLDEIQLYESHPIRGVQILGSLGTIPDDIIRIVHEHHERGSGQGFPRRLVNSRIHPMARVVALADEFCNQTLKNPNCQVPRSPQAATEYLEKVLGQPFDKDSFRALKEAVSGRPAKKPRAA